MTNVVIYRNVKIATENENTWTKKERTNERTNKDIQIIFISGGTNIIIHAFEQIFYLYLIQFSVCVFLFFFHYFHISTCLTRKWVNCIQWNLCLHLRCRNFNTYRMYTLRRESGDVRTSCTLTATRRDWPYIAVAHNNNNIIIIYFALIFHDLMFESCSRDSECWNETEICIGKMRKVRRKCNQIKWNEIKKNSRK